MTRLKKLIYYTLLDSIRKHSDFNMVWNAIPKKIEENKEIILQIAEKISNVNLDNIESELIKECNRVFKTKIFWDKCPDDFTNILKANLQVNLNNYRKMIK